MGKKKSGFYAPVAIVDEVFDMWDIEVKSLCDGALREDELSSINDVDDGISEYELKRIMSGATRGTTQWNPKGNWYEKGGNEVV